jgi:hypothetical protein
MERGGEAAWMSRRNAHRRPASARERVTPNGHHGGLEWHFKHTNIGFAQRKTASRL